MDKLKALQDKKAAEIAAAKKYIDIDDLTDEQKAACDEHLANAKALDDDIARLKAILDAEAAMKVDAKAATAGTPLEGTDTISGGNGNDTIEASTSIQVDKNKVFPDPFETLGEQAIAIYRAQNSEGIHDGLNQIMNAAASGQNEKIDAEGGFLVQKDLATGIDKKIFEMGAIISRVDEIPLGGGSNGISFNQLKEDSRLAATRHGGVRAFWVDEAEQVTTSKAIFRKVNLLTKKVAALTFITDELMQDATALDTFLMNGMSEALTFVIEDAIIEGDGVVQPLGIKGHASQVSVAKEVGQAADTIVHENIVKMWTRMFAPSRGRSVWLINQDIEEQLQTMSLAVGTGGSPTYLPVNGLAGAPFATLLGRPVIPVEYAETLGDKGDINLVDLSQYWYVTKGGTKQASSIHLRFDFDEVAFKATKRVDGMSKWASDLTPFKGTNTQSPFVTLDARA